MSKIDKMINELCPDGVEYVKLGDVCEILDNQRKPISKSKRTSGIYPYYGANGVQDYIDNYIFDGIYLLMGEDGSVINIDKSPILNWAEGKIWVNNHAHVLSERSDVALLRYLYYILQSTDVSDIVRGTPPKINQANLRNIEIPLPPLSIQQKIVSVLDSFTTLIDKMKQEVEKRKKQMEYYCDLYYGGDIEGMMALANDSNNSVITFAELGTITRGKRFVRDDVRESGQPCIHYGDMYTYYGTKSFKANTYLDRDFPKKMRYANKGDVVIVGAGENDFDIGVGVVWMGDEPAAVHDACYILEHSQNPMYISYYLRSNIYHQQLKKHVSSGKISSFSAEGLGKVYIPIQPIEKQNEIVFTLDKFESYITKLEKMIVLRQKQYEYYREKLLTFENIKHS